MSNKQEQLKKIKARLEEIEPILNKTFKTSEELNSHVKKNKILYEEGRDLYNQIQKIENELMTPEEKERKKKVDLFLELKAKGEPFDLTEFESM